MKIFIQAEKRAGVQLYIPAREIDGKKLPEVLLPRFHYYPDEFGVKKWHLHGWFVNAGTEGAQPFIMRPVIELTEEQWESCQADPNFMSMFKKGTYTKLDSLPARFRNQSEEDRQLLAKYREALEKAGVPVPTLGALDDDALLEELTRPDGVKTA
jgi:hypothetical protein